MFSPYVVFVVYLLTRETLARACYTFPKEQNNPCRDKTCGFGASCVPSPDGRNASCQCPEKCPNYGDHATSKPICGSDGVDYKDLCELRRAACSSNTNITVKFHGKCDPCAGMECAEPEICQLDENRNPVCRCGDTCPLEFTPVCGSDGKTYSNECSLRQEACRTRKTLNIIYRGKCSSGVNPCMSVRCTLGEECAINKYGIARCECPPDCEPIMRPVCSKDGRTFSSECELRKAACLARTSVEVAYAGVCGEMGPCSEHECSFGASCVERAGAAHCECPVCPAEFEPVCGSDGISYGNECKLRLEACKHRREIRVLYDGPCNGCENKKCDFYSTCESDGATEGKCVCPKTCKESKAKETVCGTDGVTYASECELKVASCKAQQYVLVAYKGDCDMCAGMHCKFGARCEAGECVCPTNCEGFGNEPVCASNRVTFPNECELQKASCLLPFDSTPLSIVFYGDCRERFPVPGSLTTLPPTATMSISETGSSLDTASPKPAGSDVTAVEREACRDIHCDFEATCELGPDNFPRCTCQFDCARAALLSQNEPVCASDLRIYSSLCAMKMEACQRQEELRLRPLELCQGMEVKPCNGEKPLTDLTTGRELDCGNGPSRQDCPSGSYCHQTTRFSRCCLKDNSVPVQKKCEGSWYGCCPDGKTPAQGADNAGCPSLCGCNKLGSFSDTCNPETQQCKCRPGVGGLKCDRCEPGYWGLPKISSGHHGCIPCGCSTFGSVRDDCEQMTGRCVCKPGIQGQKCTVCTNVDKQLGPNGCVYDLASQPAPSHCKDLTCHFGATCIERNGRAICDCHTECDDTDTQVVCGSDHQTYASACKLRQAACRLQKDIVVQAFGNCKDDMFPGTDWPIRRYTPLQFTQPDESNSPLSKSTRHLLVPNTRYTYDWTMGRPEGRHRVPDVDGSNENNVFGPDSDIMYNTRDGNFAAAYRPTPATVRVVSALLGDLCSETSDCMIMYSTCVMGACVCLPDYSESPDRQECVADANPTDEYRACSSSPCYHGSTCIDLPLATFTCICDELFTGVLCDTEIILRKYQVPAFGGKSYVQLKPLKAYHKLSLEIEFKTYKNNGILLYDQQRADGQGDFVSLAIVDGYVQFKYNLGNGAVTIASVDKIQLNKFHRVVIKRYHKDGLLKLDDGEDIAGKSDGNLKALDLVEDAFIGYVPTNYSRVYDNIGISAGFHGCIRKLKVGRKTVELQEHRDETVVRSRGIHECGENPCANALCQNNGKCIELEDNTYRCECILPFSGDFCEYRSNPCKPNPCNDGACELSTGKIKCKCPPEKKGERCEIDSQVITPEFNGTNYIKFPKLEAVGKSFSIDVIFNSRATDGLIFYDGQMKNGQGDFISLALVRGHVQFRFNLGNGIANITTKEKITLGDWHQVTIGRKGREGSLQVDNGTVIHGYSGPNLSELNLELPFYIGSVMAWKEVHKLSGISKGFRGAIQKVSLNGRPLPISVTLQNCNYSPINNSGCAYQLKLYDGPPCPLSKNPCKNKGICIPNFNEYYCECSNGFNGKHCEFSKDTGTAIKFNGETFLQYKNRGYRSENETAFDDEYTNNEYSENEENSVLEEIDPELYDESDIEDDYNTNNNNLDGFGRKGERGNRYEIKLRTFISDGLLLWRSKHKNRSLDEDYFSIAIVNGHAELSYNLGKQKNFWAIRSKTKIDDGEWHTIQVRRRKRMGFISIDGETAVKGISDNGAISLSTNSKLWIGGMPSLPPGLPSSYYKGFEGCIQYINVNAKPLNLKKHSDSNMLEFCYDNEI